MKAIELFGKDWKKVQQYVGTRTSAQSRSHAQKVLPKTSLDQIDKITCTPQKKLKPLETEFAKDESQSDSSQSEDEPPTNKQ